MSATPHLHANSHRSYWVDTHIGAGRNPAFQRNHVRFWERTLKVWLSMLDRYETDATDHPYWWTERVNASLLAAAMWGKGYSSLVEIPNKRVGGEPTKPSRSYGQRVDIEYGTKHEFGLLELKQCWAPANAEQPDWRLRFNNKLQAARGQCEKANREGVTYAVPGVFIVPSCTSTRSADNLRACRRGASNLIKEMTSENLGMAIAYASYFPSRHKNGNRRKLYKAMKGSYYPGVLLVLGAPVT